jgi:hypothetical protein
MGVPLRLTRCPRKQQRSNFRDDHFSGAKVIHFAPFLLASAKKPRFWRTQTCC